MSNNELQLFVFEGGRAESKYVEQLERNFLGKGISQLYKSLSKGGHCASTGSATVEGQQPSKGHNPNTATKTVPEPVEGQQPT